MRQRARVAGAFVVAFLFAVGSAAAGQLEGVGQVRPGGRATSPAAAKIVSSLRGLIDEFRVEGITLEFTDDAIDAIADLAAEANGRLENIGARRLMTVVECVVETLAFDAPDMAAEGQTHVTIDGAVVRERVGRVLRDEDLTRFVL